MSNDNVQQQVTSVGPLPARSEDEILRLKDVVLSLQRQLSAVAGAAARGVETAARALREHHANGWDQVQDTVIPIGNLSPERNDDLRGSSIKRAELCSANECTDQGSWNPDQDQSITNTNLPDLSSPSQALAGPGNYIPSPSVFCLDVLELEGSVRQLITTQHLSESDKEHSFDALLRSIFDLMVSKHYWHSTKDWWILTNAFQTIGVITRYRIEPTSENYARLPACFRPTRLQFTRFHWPVVDWIAWPDMRDKLILHAADYDLSEVILATMRSYCLEEEVNSLPENTNGSPSQSLGYQTHIPAGGPKAKVYYRVEEYVEYTKQKVLQRHIPRTISARLEAKLILALQAEETPMKLEPAFFERFPGLSSEAAITHGTYRSIYDAE
ncbi:hypothetical protein AYL99_07489 [Fonsecaea erecta]|uniref:Uncharacterized protein n=1 Tax=Fonsecaea erecta TaxID=1367422 RepID=A0A178ZF36_9EURO|nr:hypothetical protein AYL99_07489 [Fonsecaea erecta]OAP58399.1 hypothetical protein AYL99_07489 [Fonsecaea erecta]